MKKINYFLLSIYMLLLINGCKSVVSKQIEKAAIAEEIDVKIPPFEYKRDDVDSILLRSFIKYYKDNYAKDSSQTNYYGAELLYQKDSIFKVINLYGDYVGATYNPFAESHIAYRNKLYAEFIYGETFRIDKLSPSKYLFYTDDFNRLSSSFHFYNVTFNNDSVVIEPTSNYRNYKYDLIQKKKETLENLSDEIGKSRKLERNELYTLDVDSLTIEANENYYVSPEGFLSRENSDGYSIVYYHQKYGDETEKVVRFIIEDTVREITLGITGGDSDGYKMTSEFVNDSVFVQSLVHKETIKESNDTMGYAFDSIVTKFRYNEKFELDTISKDTFKYKKYRFKRYNQPVENHIFYSMPFKINGLNCFWITTTEVIFRANGTPLKAKDISRKLINSETKKPILSSQNDMIIGKENDLFYSLIDNFKDFNFDGYLDFSIYNSVCSGASHAFYDTYLFNPKTKKFDYRK
ncbi:XAC2610-related protein [Flavobacterium sp.]|uniref:XAC2610-related protein n=1 Tax=Flavobacterium sp. TaxID=239 RepID=UPI00375134CA